MPRRTMQRRAVREGLRMWGASLLLLPVCLYFCVTWGDYTLLDNADLIIHEAGHFVFRPFGRTIYMLGGTLMQVLLPSLLAWHFLVHAYRLGAQLALFWLGHNLLNIGVYAADAQTRALPLLGGSSVVHDWHFLLGQYGLIAWDGAIGSTFFGLAVVTFVVLLALPRYMP